MESCGDLERSIIGEGMDGADDDFNTKLLKFIKNNPGKPFITPVSDRDRVTQYLPSRNLSYIPPNLDKTRRKPVNESTDTGISEEES